MKTKFLFISLILFLIFRNISLAQEKTTLYIQKMDYSGKIGEQLTSINKNELSKILISTFTNCYITKDSNKCDAIVEILCKQTVWPKYVDNVKFELVDFSKKSESSTFEGGTEFIINYKIMDKKTKTSFGNIFQCKLKDGIVKQESVTKSEYNGIALKSLQINATIDFTKTKQLLKNELKTFNPLKRKNQIEIENK